MPRGLDGEASPVRWPGLLGLAPIAPRLHPPVVVSVRLGWSCPVPHIRGARQDPRVTPAPARARRAPVPANALSDTRRPTVGWTAHTGGGGCATDAVSGRRSGSRVSGAAWCRPADGGRGGAFAARECRAGEGRCAPEGRTAAVAGGSASRGSGPSAVQPTGRRSTSDLEISYCAPQKVHCCAYRVRIGMSGMKKRVNLVDRRVITCAAWLPQLRQTC